MYVRTNMEQPTHNVTSRSLDNAWKITQSFSLNCLLQPKVHKRKFHWQETRKTFICWGHEDYKRQGAISRHELTVALAVGTSTNSRERRRKQQSCHPAPAPWISDYVFMNGKSRHWMNGEAKFRQLARGGMRVSGNTVSIPCMEAMYCSLPLVPDTSVFTSLNPKGKGRSHANELTVK